MYWYIARCIYNYYCIYPTIKNCNLSELNFINKNEFIFSENIIEWSLFLTGELFCLTKHTFLPFFKITKLTTYTLLPPMMYCILLVINIRIIKWQLSVMGVYISEPIQMKREEFLKISFDKLAPVYQSTYVSLAITRIIELLLL